MGFEDISLEGVLGRGRHLVRTPQGMRPLKVLHLSALISGERGKVAYLLHRALRASGIDSLMVTRDVRERDNYHLLSVMPADIPAGGVLPGASLRANRLCAEADIIHLHDVDGFVNPLDVRSAFADKKAAWSFCSSAGSSLYVPAIRPDSDLLFFHTREHANAFFAQTGHPADAPHIVPPALPLPFYQRHLRPYGKEAYGLRSDGRLVLCFLPTGSELAAYRKILAPLADEKEIDLLFIGPENTYKELGINGQRYDTLPRHKLVEEALLYALAEVLLLPGTGAYDWLLAWEAIGHGLPVAVPESYIAREIVGDCGFSCRAGGEEELGRVISEFCRGDDISRNVLRERCLRKAIDNCAFVPRAEYCARAYMNLLKNG